MCQGRSLSADSLPTLDGEQKVISQRTYKTKTTALGCLRHLIICRVSRKQNLRGELSFNSAGEDGEDKKKRGKGGRKIDTVIIVILSVCVDQKTCVLF